MVGCRVTMSMEMAGQVSVFPDWWERSPSILMFLKKSIPTDRKGQQVPSTSVVRPAVYPDPVLLVGAGGHGRVVADAWMSMHPQGRLIVWDRHPVRAQGELLAGVTLVDESIARGRGSAVHVSIGDNRAREREARAWSQLPFVSVVHPAATVSALARLDAGCFVAAGAVVGPLTRVGEGTIINHGALVDHDTQLGCFCHIAPNATLGGAVQLGDRVLVGAGATILPGVVVADDVVIGAATVVLSDLPEAGTYVGIPARRIR